MPTLTLNQVDPSKTLDIRKKYTNQQRRIFATAVSQTEATLAALPDNPTQNQIDAYLVALLALLMLPLSNGVSLYPYVQAAYLRGVTNANLDLRAGGIAVTGAEFAVLTQAVHRFSLQAKQDQTQAILRSVYVDTVGGIGSEFGQVAERPLVDRVKGQLRKGLNLAVLAGGTALVGIVADAFLNRVMDFGIGLVSAVAEAKFTTMGDAAVCVQCQELETRDNGYGPGVYTIAEARGIIPVHHNCLSPDTFITSVDGIASISKRAYEGDLIVINTASGKQIAVTPNHPVLTWAGWIAAKDINVGDEMFSDELSPTREDNTKNRPSTIEEIFNASLVDSSFFSVNVPISPKDFHNDTGIRQSEIAVISANRHLLDNHFSRVQQGIIDYRLEIAAHFAKSLTGRSSVDSFLQASGSSPSSVMGGLDLMTPLLFGHSSPFDSFRHGLCTTHNPVIGKPFVDNGSRDAVLFREGIFGDSRPILADDFFNWQVDTVESTGCISFSGHVYNLHTKKGYYSANNIITHNCRCSWSAIVLGKDVPFLRF